MTLLHQAAQKAVEALTLTEEEREHIHQAIDKLGDYEYLRPELRTETSRTRGVLQKLFRFLPQRMAALQQQPEPVATLDIVPMAEPRITLLSARSNLPLGSYLLYTAPVVKALRYCHECMVSVKGPCQYKECPVRAIQQQEVPREPVAIWQSKCKDGTWVDCDEANARAGERYGFKARVLYAASPSTTQQQEAGSEPDAMEAHRTNGLAWAVSCWQAEVMNRPLVNVHRRTLDDTWRQVIRYFGGDPDKLLGPNHDTLHMRAQEERAWKP